MARILLVEDNANIAAALKEHLEADTHEVTVLQAGSPVVETVYQWDADLVVLDLMLPDIPGEAVLDSLRRAGSEVPVLILSARADEATKVKGLRTGADDYVTKPFSLKELLARVDNLLLRRSPVRSMTASIFLGDVEVRPAAREVIRAGQRLELRPRAMDLLLSFLQRPNTAISREDLLRRVWRYHRSARTRTVDWHVAELRRQLEADPDQPRFFQTVRRVGYRLVLPPDDGAGLP